MFGRFNYKSCTAAQLQADLTAFLCGAAPSSLVYCDAVNTYIEGGASSLWSVVDLPYGVIKAPVTGGGAGDKVFQLQVGGSYLQARSMESWNAATHAALNSTALAGALSYSLAGGVLYFNVTAEALSLWSGNSAFLTLAECTRSVPVMTGRPAGIVLCESLSWSLPRVKNTAAAGETAPLTGISPRGNSTGSTALRGDGELPFYQVTDLLLQNSNTILLGSVPGIMAGPAVGNCGDLLLLNDGKPWFLLRASATTCLLHERK